MSLKSYNHLDITSGKQIPANSWTNFRTKRTFKTFDFELYCNTWRYDTTKKMNKELTVLESDLRCWSWNLMGVPCSHRNHTMLVGRAAEQGRSVGLLLFAARLGRDSLIVMLLYEHSRGSWKAFKRGWKKFGSVSRYRTFYLYLSEKCGSTFACCSLA